MRTSPPSCLHLSLCFIFFILCIQNAPFVESQRVFTIGVLVPASTFFNETLTHVVDSALEYANREWGARDSFVLKKDIFRFSSTKQVVGTVGNWGRNPKIVGVVGPTTSATTLAVSLALKPSDLPVMIGPSSTVNLFSNIVSLTSTLDDQLDTIAELISLFEWRYPAFLYTKDPYGSTARDTFMKYAYQFNPYVVGIETNNLEYQLKELNASAVRVFVFFAMPDESLVVIETARRLKMLSSGYVWIGGEPTTLIPLLHRFDGLIAVQSKQGSGEIYNEYYKSRETNDPKVRYDSVPYTPNFYDAVLIFAQTISKALKLGQDPFNHTVVKDLLDKDSFTTTRGVLSINQYRDSQTASLINFYNQSWHNIPSIKNTTQLPRIVFPGINPRSKNIPGRTVSFGWIGPLNTDRGQQFKLASALALTEINVNDNLLPFINLTVFYASSQSDRVEASHSLMGNLLPKGVVAVCGAESSDVSESLKYILSNQKIPQVSAESTSSSLYPNSSYFRRIAPPDFLQAEAIISLVLHFGWNSVSVIFSADVYGTNALADFSNALEKYTHKSNFTRIPPQSFLPGRTQSLKNQLETIKRSRSRVVVILARSVEVNKVLENANEYDMLTPEYVWIGSDGTRSANVSDPKLYVGLLATSPTMGTDHNIALLKSKLQIDNSTELWPSTAYWYDAMWYMAFAIHDVLFVRNVELNGENLLESLSDNTVASKVHKITGDIVLSEHLERLQSYDIWNYQDGRGWVRVMIWNISLDDNAYRIQPFEHENVTFRGPFIPSGLAGYTYVRLSFKNLEGKVVAAGVCATLVIIIVTGYFMLRMRRHGVIKSVCVSYLCLVLVGLSFGNVAVLMYLLEPTKELCNLRLWLQVLSLTLLLGPLFIRNYRIYQVLGDKQGKKEEQEVKLSPLRLFVTQSILSICPIAVLITQMVMQPLVPNDFGPTADENTFRQRCYISSTSRADSLSPYDHALISLGVVALLGNLVVAFFIKDLKVAHREGNMNRLTIANGTFCFLLAATTILLTDSLFLLKVLIISVAICQGTLATLGFLIWFKFYRIWKPPQTVFE